MIVQKTIHGNINTTGTPPFNYIFQLVGALNCPSFNPITPMSGTVNVNQGSIPFTFEYDDEDCEGIELRFEAYDDSGKCFASDIVTVYEDQTCYHQLGVECSIENEVCTQDLSFTLRDNLIAEIDIERNAVKTLNVTESSGVYTISFSSIGLNASERAEIQSWFDNPCGEFLYFQFYTDSPISPIQTPFLLLASATTLVSMNNQSLVLQVDRNIIVPPGDCQAEKQALYDSYFETIDNRIASGFFPYVIENLSLGLSCGDPFNYTFDRCHTINVDTNADDLQISAEAVYQDPDSNTVIDDVQNGSKLCAGEGQTGWNITVIACGETTTYTITFTDEQCGFDLADAAQKGKDTNSETSKK